MASGLGRALAVTMLGAGIGIGVSLGLLYLAQPGTFGDHVPVLGALYIIGGSLASMAIARIDVISNRRQQP